jgi:hypothetical protein
MALYEINGLNAPFGSYTATITETVTAGDFLKPAGSTELTTSTYKTAATAALGVAKCDANGDEALVCGVALDSKTYSATSVDNTIDVASRGVFLMCINAAVTNGQMVCQMGGATNMYVTPAEAGGRQIGVAITAANTQGEYIVVLMTGLGPTGAEA